MFRHPSPPPVREKSPVEKAVELHKQLEGVKAKFTAEDQKKFEEVVHPRIQSYGCLY